MRKLLILSVITLFAVVRPSVGHAQSCGSGAVGFGASAIVTALNQIPSALTAIRIQTKDRWRWHRTHWHYERLCKVNYVVRDIIQALTMICGTMDSITGLTPLTPMGMAFTGHMDAITGGLDTITSAAQTMGTPGEFMDVFDDESMMIGGEIDSIMNMLPNQPPQPDFYWYRENPSALGGRCHGGGPPI